MKREKDLLDLGLQDAVAQFIHENPDVAKSARQSVDISEFISELNVHISGYESSVSEGTPYAEGVRNAVRRIKIMLEYEGLDIKDLPTGKNMPVETFGLLWGVLNEDRVDEVGADFMLDIIHLFRALNGIHIPAPGLRCVKQYARRWAHGLDPKVVEIREVNRRRITELLIERIELRSASSNKRYFFPQEASQDQKRELVAQWWGDFRFHLAMAIRSPRELNKYLDNSLSAEVLQRLLQARNKEMPFFITPYYASLLDIHGHDYDDLTIRSYVIYSQELVDAYGDIRAWEKEDEVVAGERNAAGWMLPEGGNIHRRYPEVAIFIPDSMGRACGGLCAPCQRMYDFQNRRLNFEFSKLRPNEHWESKLRRLMRYFEYDPELRDILITGGDALMSQNKTLRNILRAVLRMATRKQNANKKLSEGEKRAQIDRVRLGTRIPAYLPMKIDDELIDILSEFRQLGLRAGISQFIIQTHFESPLEITPEAHRAIRALLSSGWLVTNQLVFTVAASRRGHTARLREMLTREGVICYYTFSVKGFAENYALFTPNSRSLQEQHEEKIFGIMTPDAERELACLLDSPETLQNAIIPFMERHNLPFIATDRNVLNLPGIGKSMTFTTVGLTAGGERILKFDHDHSRRHSPVIESMGEVFITENKSVAAYLRQLRDMGEKVSDYASIWRYASGVTEPRFSIYEYPGRKTGS